MLFVGAIVVRSICEGPTIRAWTGPGTRFPPGSALPEGARYTIPEMPSKRRPQGEIEYLAVDPRDVDTPFGRVHISTLAGVAAALAACTVIVHARREFI